MSLSRKKNVIHSIRMDQELEEKVNREAEARHLTFNNLVNSILRRYSEFDTYAERFGFVTITRNTYQALVSAIDDDGIEAIARDVSSLALKEFTYFKYNEPSVRSFIDFTALQCNYGGLGMYEEKTQGLDHMIIVRHHLGVKVSKLFGLITAETMKRMADIDVKVDASSENEVVIRFKADPFNL